MSEAMKQMAAKLMNVMLEIYATNYDPKAAAGWYVEDVVRESLGFKGQAEHVMAQYVEDAEKILAKLKAA